MFEFVALLLVSATFGTEPFEVEAKLLSASRTAGVYHAKGDVVLRRPGLVAYADRMTFYEKEQRVEASGNVVLVEGLAVTRCSKVILKVPELVGGLASAELRIKKGITPYELSRTPKAELSYAGEDDVLVTAERIEKSGPREFSISNGSFTPCHCAEDAKPSWHIETSSASIDFDSGAFLNWPVFHVKDLPVMGLPWFYLPLGERRSGLLMPRVQHTSVTGWAVRQPLYLTLGRSWDATFGVRYFFDRGPSPDFEVRWSPTRHSNGWIRFSSLFDYGVYDPLERTWSASADENVFRFSVAALHRQRWGLHRFGVELNATGDPVYIAEFADQYLSRQSEYTQSRATYTYNDRAHVRVAAGLNLTQDLRAHRYPGLELKTVNLFSGDRGPNEVGGPGNVRYRFADLRLDAFPYPLLEGLLPVYGAAVVSAQAFAAPWPIEPRFGRVDFRPQLFVPLSLGGLFALETELAGRMTSWSGRFDSENYAYNRWSAVSRSKLSTEIMRSYKHFTHRIRPTVQHVFIPTVNGDGPGLFETRDEIDVLAPAHQVSVGLYTDWLRNKSAARTLYLGAHAGYNIDNSSTDDSPFAPLVLEAGLSVKPLGDLRTSLSSTAFLDWEKRSLEEIAVSGRVQWGRTISLGATWLEYAEDVSRRTFIAPEELVPSSTLDRSAYLSPTEYRTSLSTNNLDVVPWSAYRGMLLSAVFRPMDPLTISGGFSRDFGETALEIDKDAKLWDHFKQLSGSIRWDSPCKCWSAAIMVNKARDRETPDVRFVLDLARLGGITY